MRKQIFLGVVVRAGRRGEDARAQVPVRQYTAVDTTHVVADSLCLLPHRQGGVRELVLESIVHGKPADLLPAGLR